MTPQLVLSFSPDLLLPPDCHLAQVFGPNSDPRATCVVHLALALHNVRIIFLVFLPTKLIKRSSREISVVPLECILYFSEQLASQQEQVWTCDRVAINRISPHQDHASLSLFYCNAGKSDFPADFRCYVRASTPRQSRRACTWHHLSDSFAESANSGVVVT
jgi:hypothetical protein